MKTFLNYLFVLCPSIVIYGCSNDDKDMVICPYPSFECENAKGDLIYDTENKQQEIHLAPDGETLISSIEDHGSHVWGPLSTQLAVTVTGNGNGSFFMFGLNFLRITAITGITNVFLATEFFSQPKWASILPSSIFSNTWACSCFRKLLTSFCLKPAKELLA